MRAEEIFAIERECARLPLLFARYADTGNHAALAELFAKDCVFARPFQPQYPFHGRERVQAIFRDRKPILVRHIVTNVIVDVESATRATGSNYLTMLSSHASVVPPQPSGTLYVGGFEDEYVLEDGRWRFATRLGMVALHQGGPMPEIPPPTDEARGTA